MARRRLLLFDIDGTLLDTGGAGGASLLDAVEDILGVARHTLPPLDLAGATDGGVIRTLLGQVGQAWEAALVSRYLQAYVQRLQARVDHADFRGRLLPGVTALLTRLAASGQADLGLLTGNIRAGADIKLRRFDIHTHFIDGAFGDDAEDRNLLGPVAVQRMQEKTGHTYPPEEVIVIGDTPKDIACAAALGARCLAVGTGVFAATALASHTPWQCLENLEDTHAVHDLLVG